MKKILIVEDDQRIAQNIRRGLTDEGYDTRVAYEGVAGQQLGLQQPFDLVILDVNLPGMDGYEICRSLRKAKPHLPIIMLTALGEIEDKVEGLKHGADDYLVKPFDFRELNARIAACFRRLELVSVPTQDEILRVADLEINVTTKLVRRAGTPIELTAREFALLDYLARNQGRVVSKLDLAERVWSHNFDTGTNVVEVYINYLRKKIDRDFEPKLIHTRSGLGYVLKADAS